MDGLPGMKKGIEIGKTKKVEPIKKMVGPYSKRANRGRGAGVAFENVVIIALLSLVLGALLGLYGEVLSALVAPPFRSVCASLVSFDSIPVVRSFVKNDSQVYSSVLSRVFARH
jgi:hypothetical protein